MIPDLLALENRYRDRGLRLVPVSLDEPAGDVHLIIEGDLDGDERRAIEAGAALRVNDAGALLESALKLLNDAPARARMGDAGLAFAARHRGAAARVEALIEPLLAAGAGRSWPGRPD